MNPSPASGSDIPARDETSTTHDESASMRESVATVRDDSTAFQSKNRYDLSDLLACAEGRLFGPGNAQLPSPPMLMFDTISEITETGGAYARGCVRAELKIRPDLWFFDCHFHNDPVMPGCLGLDALWQLLGFFLAWSGSPGRGRALGVGDVKFTDQVLPGHGTVTYGIDIRRTVRTRLVMGLADGWLKFNGRQFYSAKNLRVGLFHG